MSDDDFTRHYNDKIRAEKRVRELEKEVEALEKQVEDLSKELIRLRPPQGLG